MAKNNSFLRILGFPDPDGKILKNDELFIVPNKDAFQRVSHILYLKCQNFKVNFLICIFADYSFLIVQIG